MDVDTDTLSFAEGCDDLIEADSFQGSESDRSNGVDSLSTISTSSDVWHFQEENGRTYHSYRAGSYLYPNDVSETDRLDYQHWIIDFALQGILHYAPLENPLNILDIGTGTGTWAIQIGDAYPGATVEATDLSPIQPNDVPANVRFLVDDAEEEDWAIPENHYDYIHTRLLMGCMEDFSAIIKHAFRHTTPGGWMESHDVMMGPYCDDGSMPDDWPFREWSESMSEAAERAGRPLKIANKLKRWYIEAGFVDVQQRIVKIPINAWPKDRGLKALGHHWAEDILSGLQGFSLALFHRVFGWTKTEIEVYLVNVRKALIDTSVHSYNKYYMVWGRKPNLNEPTPSIQVHPPPIQRPVTPILQIQDPVDVALPDSPLEFIPEFAPEKPAEVPSELPSGSTTEPPTKLLEEVPTEMPREVPSQFPSSFTSEVHSELPTALPTELPTVLPTEIPSQLPLGFASEVLSGLPTEVPPEAASQIPSDFTSGVPSKSSSELHSELPRESSFGLPSGFTSEFTFEAPTKLPTELPSELLQKPESNFLPPL